MQLEPKIQLELSGPRTSTILVVDDDYDIRSLTRTFLEHEGYGVLTSGDADRAEQIFRSCSHIDLLIADYCMPLRSGLDLALELKRLQPALPILIISGAFLEPPQLNLLRGQGWSFLAKPFSLPKLLATVHKILQAVPSIGLPLRSPATLIR